MGGVSQSGMGFVDPLNVTGWKQDPSAPQYSMSALNSGQTLNDMNSVYGVGETGNAAQDLLGKYASGKISSDDLLKSGETMPGSAASRQGLSNALATGPTTGSKFATEQVMNNPILGQLFGDQGGLQSQMGIMNNLQSQGFNLQPQDQSLYGQEAGGIARQFGQQGNQAASDLASRGLSSSGAAGAQFSGIAGNQNEMLANAQQQIAQQRFQNTQNQIAQQQSFVSNLGQQGANDINQQYGRQASGVQNQYAGLGSQQTAGNQAANYGLAGAEFQQQNKPATFSDLTQGAVSQAAGGFGKSAGQAMGAGMFA